MTYARMRAYLIVGVLVLAAAITVIISVVNDTQSDAATGDCPAGTPRANLTLPAEAAQVKLRVLNGTRRAGMAEQVSEDFKNRGFAVQPAAKSKNKNKDIAIIQYGPKSVGAAQWIKAFFLGEATPEFSAERTTDVIDIVIGDRYQQLATDIEVKQSLAQLSAPELPPGTCAA
ncbi:LytR C-terminal domain-containing protein [Actinoplanes sp. NPDC051861]|uniref:LytR C-terminal domain-containing protein n=1 Tax=Actinoplanes sp. NPDC051861 TaxID=3155170 RepID=UPI0034392532